MSSSKGAEGVNVIGIVFSVVEKQGQKGFVRDVALIGGDVIFNFNVIL